MRRRNFLRPRHSIAALTVLPIVLLLVLGTVTCTVGKRHANRLTADKTQFSSVVIRGGGFVTGLSVEGNSMYARTDVGGAYRYDNDTQRWEQMISTSSVAADHRLSDYQVEAVGAAPSDPAIVYMLVGSTSDSSPGARIFRSNDSGRNWTVQQTNWQVSGNGDYRQSGARIAVDPTDPNLIFVGTRRNGLQLSTDGGKTWRESMAAPRIAEGSDAYDIGVSTVVIDPSSPIADGRHVGVWAGVAGIGLMHSTNAGHSWKLASPFGTGFVSDLGLKPDGSVVACFYGLGDSTRSYVRRLDTAGGVADITPSQAGRWLTVAIDPDATDNIIVASESVVSGSGIYATHNGSAKNPTWLAIQSSLSAGEDGTTWPIRSDVFKQLSTGQIRYFNGHIWFAEGVGTWRTKSSFSNSLSWQFSSAGIEEFVANAVYKPRTAPLLTAEWDRGLMRHPDPSNQRPQNGQEATFPYTSQFGSAWDINASPTDPRFLVAILDDHQDVSGRTYPLRRASAYSTNGGATWTRFYGLANGSAPPDLLFGNIAVSASNNSNIVWVPSNLEGLETKIYYSNDAGTTWSRGQMKGLRDGEYLHNNYVQARKILVADPVMPGRFYALGSDTTGAAMVWESNDRGATWRLTWSSGPSGSGNGFKYDSTLVAAGEYVIAAPGGGGGCMYRSKDRRQWEKLCSLQGALGMGVGAPIEDKNGNAALYSYGTANGVTGIYRSTDYGTSWKFLANQPDGLYVGIRAIAGDPEVRGRFYIALAGNGFLIGQS